MVRYNQAYKGTTHVGCIIKNGKIVKKIYKGSELVYKLGFDTFTINAGTSLYAWKVPMGVEKIHIDCVASRGAHGQAGHSDVGENLSNGGNGGRVQCDMKVTGGETLYITVGAIPSNQNVAAYNASDIRAGGTGYNNRILVAGGGGSGCYNRGDNSRTGLSAGANGGGTTGASSETATRRAVANGATGGTQSGGGTGSNTGTFGLGGTGAGGASNYAFSGAGGAGWYGGGGGNTGLGKHDGKRYKAASGGGGGSSYANTSRCSAISHTQGYTSGSGYITISYVW